MLRCPKCSRIYQSGGQRFCTNDGGRLISVAEMNRAAENALSSFDFADSQNESNNDWRPRRQTGRLVLPPQIEIAANGFSSAPQTAKKLDSPPFKTDVFNKPQPAQIPAAPVLVRRPTGRLVLPSDIPDSSAPTGDRSVNPTGRLAFTNGNPNALIGQNVKGRYTVDKVLQQDSFSVSYLAHDRLGEYRQVLIKIWLKDFQPEAEETKRFYEERGALSHLNHPNIARILDTGDLAEGKPFVINEFPEGLTLREAMQISGQFPVGRAARIVRQIAQALTEAHNNRLTHRNLKPENIVLRTDEGGEQVKVFNFGVAGEEADNTNSIAYVAPECVIGDLWHAEADIFALGVVAYEMLAGRKPFAGATEDELLDAEELGLAVKPTNLRLDLNASVDAVLERALAFSRAERFHHAREFGESLFNALTENSNLKSSKILPNVVEPTAKTNAESAAPAKNFNPQSTMPAEPVFETLNFKKLEQTQPALGTVTTVPQSKKPSGKTKWLIAAACILGIVALTAAVLLNRNLPQGEETQQAYVTRPIETPAQIQTSIPTTEQTAQPQPIDSQTDEEQSLPPIPPNYLRFENAKSNLNPRLAQKFVSFSLAYPRNWQITDSAANFLDVSNRTSDGLPLEQLLVSWYESKGTLTADGAALPKLINKLTAAFAKDIPSFRETSEGATTFNNRPAYEFKFTGETPDSAVKIYGRTIFVPVGRENAETGLLLTMLGTDLSPVITGAADVGEKGELKDILSTFVIE